MDIKKLCDRELMEMQEYCKELTRTLIPGIPQAARDIHTIALTVINGELDDRKIRKEK